MIIWYTYSGPSEAYILAREDAISVWRRLMGPTKVFECQLSNPDSIRAKHGLTDTRNATHGSGNFVLFDVLINGVILINTHILFTVTLLVIPWNN